MIDEQVITLAKRFAQTWSDLFRDQPRYVLDFTWPTIGVLDLLTFSLRGKERYDRDDFSLLQGSAAYFASMIHHCWSQFPDKVNVDIRMASNNGEIAIIARDGRFLRHGEQFMIPLTRVIGGVLRDQPQPFPFFEQTTRVLEPEHNLLSLLGIGFVTGLCPFGQGVWREKTDKEMTPYIVTAEAACAESCARYYERVYPADEIGRNPRLYRSNLILPPALHREPFPAVHAAVGLARYLRDIDCPADQALNLALNLAYNPDELISSAGYAVAVALTDGSPSVPLRMLSESIGKYKVELRPAAVLARKVLGKPEDFLVSLEQGQFDQAKVQLHLEYDIGMLPLWRIRFAHVNNRNLLQLIKALTWAQTAPARIIIDQLMSHGISDVDIQLQGAFLDIFLGDFKRAEEELDRVRAEDRLSDTDDQMNYLELRGMIEFHAQQLEEACDTFRDALKLKSEQTERYVSIGIYLALALMMLGNHAEALDALDLVIKRDDSSIPARANRVLVLRELGRDTESENELLRLSRSAPADRRIFKSLVTRLATQQGVV